MINEGRIQCFLALARTLSFTETADQLYMTQQGVSKNIARIEEELGFPLFCRSKRAVTLTPAGEECSRIFSRFMKEYEDFIRRGQERYRQEKNSVRVGYQNWLNLGPAVVRTWSEVRRQRPEVEVAGERHPPGLLNQRLADGELDMILIHKRFALLAGDMHTMTLTTTPMELLVSPENQGTEHRTAAEAFDGEPLLVDAFETESVQEAEDRARRENQLYGLHPERIIVLPNRDSSYVAAELGHGVIVATAMSQNSTLRRYPLGVEEELLCVWRDGPKAELMECFAWMLRSEFQKDEKKTEKA